MKENKVNKVNDLQNKIANIKNKKIKARSLRDRAEKYRVEADQKLAKLQENLKLARAAKCLKRSEVNKQKITEVLNLLRKGRQYNREAIFLLYKMQNLRPKKVEDKNKK